MPACEAPGCARPAGLFVKGFCLCDRHADVVIDSLRESGLTVAAATRDLVEQKIQGKDPRLGRRPPKR